MRLCGTLADGRGDRVGGRERRGVLWGEKKSVFFFETGKENDSLCELCCIPTSVFVRPPPPYPNVAAQLKNKKERKGKIA